MFRVPFLGWANEWRWFGWTFCFVNITENSVEIYHVFKSKSYVTKMRSNWTDQFWQDIKEMGGSVSRTEGECEVEYSSEINLEEFKKI